MRLIKDNSLTILIDRRFEFAKVALDKLDQSEPVTLEAPLRKLPRSG